MQQRELVYDALTAARAGEQLADQNADPQWKAAALDALYRVCRENETFVVDAIHRLVKPGVTTHDKRAIAGVLKEGERRGWCRKSGELARSEQRQCHANLRSVRVSLIYEGRP